MIIENMSIERRDVAAQSFLDLLELCRIVLLQDIIFLRPKFPSVSLWLNSPFNQSAFEDFSTRLLYEVEHGNDPMYIQIAKTIPHLSHLLRDRFNNTLDTINTHYNSNEIRMNRVEIILNECLQYIKPMSSFTTRLLGEDLIARIVITMESESDSLDNSDRNNRLLESSTIVIGNSASIEEIYISQYRLNPTIKMMIDLWEEYDRGFIPDIDMPRGSAIRDLNERFGVKWRVDDKCRKSYNRRKLIWEAILRVSTNLKLPPETVAEKIQRWQDNNKYSLNKIHNLLSANTIGIWGENDIELSRIV